MQNCCLLLLQLYQFLPSLLMPTLTSIAVLCIINNNNSAFRALSSGYKGFGVLNFSLDWNAVGAMGPLSTPWVSVVRKVVNGKVIAEANACTLLPLFSVG